MFVRPNFVRRLHCAVLCCAGVLLTSCTDRPEASLYLEPTGGKVPIGGTVTVGAQITNPPPGAQYLWRAKRGTLDPQEATDRRSTKYTAPAERGEDVIALEIKAGTRTLWSGDLPLEIIAGPAPAPAPSLADASLPEPLGQQAMIASFSEVGQWGAFFQPGNGKAQEKIVTDAEQSRGKVMRLDYDVSRRGNYSGLWLRFGFSDFQPGQWPVLSFWLRGDAQSGYTKKLKVELKIREANWGWRIFYLTNVTDKWQQFRLRLDGFEPMERWNKPDEFVLTLENSAATTPKGVLYLDDIAMEKQ